jgi:hypothetical protein
MEDIFIEQITAAGYHVNDSLTPRNMTNVIPIAIQCFKSSSLKYLSAITNIPLIQLMGISDSQPTPDLVYNETILDEIKSYAQEGEGELARGFTHSLVIDEFNEYLDDPAYIAVMDEIMKPALKDFLFFDSFSVIHEEPPNSTADPRLETWFESKFSKLQLRLREFAATPTVHLVGTSAATGGGCTLGDATDFEKSDAAGPVGAEATVEAKSMNKKIEPIPVQAPAQMTFVQMRPTDEETIESLSYAPHTTAAMSLIVEGSAANPRILPQNGKNTSGRS